MAVIKVDDVYISYDKMLLRNVFGYFLHALLFENHNVTRQCTCDSDAESFAKF
jgi:hypothetical protein